mmetsp:Transcript_25815/g.36306  ORF Transcript_25815/g.36306 Transcript_25815/m.36306 type:complete len:549 (+) Transcript_25815:62-1708(+)
MAQRQQPVAVYKTMSGTKMIKDYIVGRTLGEGTYGKVKEGTHFVTQKKVALKFMKHFEHNPFMDREIEIMKLLDHPNIVKLYDVVHLEDGETVLVMELVTGGELFDYILSKGKLSEKEASQMVRQTLSALKYCHEHMVVHRDLKPENILLDENRNVKITDFGVSNIMKPGVRLQSRCGSPLYASPELLLDKTYIGPEVDVWAMGVILYAMVTGCMPWEGEVLSQQIGNAVYGNYVEPWGITRECAHLIGRMLTPDPKKRATVAEMYLHPWVNKGAAVPLAHSLTIHKPPAREEIDTDILFALMLLGFEREDVVKALQANTVTEYCVGMYYLMKKHKEKKKREEELQKEMEEALQKETRSRSQSEVVVSKSDSDNSTSSAESDSPKTPRRKDSCGMPPPDLSLSPSKQRFFDRFKKENTRKFRLSMEYVKEQLQVEDLSTPLPQSPEETHIRIRKIKLVPESSRIIRKTTCEIMQYLERNLQEQKLTFKKKLKKGLVYSCKDDSQKTKFELEICEPEAVPGVRVVQYKRKKGDLTTYKNFIGALGLDQL